MTPFPKGEDTDDTLPRPQRNLFTIKLYCTCRMPDIYDEKMISCDQCQKWYHFCCVDMALGEVAPPPTQWMCNDCICMIRYFNGPSLLTIEIFFIDDFTDEFND